MTCVVYRRYRAAALTPEGDKSRAGRYNLGRRPAGQGLSFRLDAAAQRAPALHRRRGSLATSRRPRPWVRSPDGASEVAPAGLSARSPDKRIAVYERRSHHRVLKVMGLRTILNVNK